MFYHLILFIVNVIFLNTLLSIKPIMKATAPRDGKAASAGPLMYALSFSYNILQVHSFLFKYFMSTKMKNKNIIVMLIYICHSSVP